MCTRQKKHGSLKHVLALDGLLTWQSVIEASCQVTVGGNVISVDVSITFRKLVSALGGHFFLFRKALFFWLLFPKSYILCCYFFLRKATSGGGATSPNSEYHFSTIFATSGCFGVQNYCLLLFVLFWLGFSWRLSECCFFGVLFVPRGAGLSVFCFSGRKGR